LIFITKLINSHCAFFSYNCNQHHVLCARFLLTFTTWKKKSSGQNGDFTWDFLRLNALPRWDAEKTDFAIVFFGDWMTFYGGLLFYFAECRKCGFLS